MSGTKNTTSIAANDRGGHNQTARRAPYVCTPIIAQTPRKCKNQFRQTTTELGRLRREYQAAVLAEDWGRAAELQRRYHNAERRRRAELLAQAGVRRG